MSDRESVSRTLGVAAGVAVFCSLLVTSVALWLRPLQVAYESIAQNRAVLEAAGLVEPGAAISEREIVDRILGFEIRIVDLGADAVSETVSASAYRFREAINDPDLTEPVAPELDLAKLGRRPLYLPVYLLIDGSRIERIVFPVFGEGMWSTIHGFISLRDDFATIEGVVFYEHGETPGIGDRIQNPAWLAQWRGQPLYDDREQLVFRIGVDGADTATNSGIDAITGATVTVSAVEDLVRYWFGADGFGPYLSAMRREARQ